MRGASNLVLDGFYMFKIGIELMLEMLIVRLTEHVGYPARPPEHSITKVGRKKVSRYVEITGGCSTSH
jgi:hypothetical protein